MQYEVEQKFRVSDWSSVKEKLRSMGVAVQKPVVQVDEYYAHPVRDFAQTDEALRIRRVGSKNWVTYKGPKIETASKTRRELELPLPDDTEGASAFAELLAVLGFHPVAEVRKTRYGAAWHWEGRPCQIALDDVTDLGFYVELEFSASDSELPLARKCLSSLAHHLELANSEQRSYLELLLDRTDG